MLKSSVNGDALHSSAQFSAEAVINVTYPAIISPF